MPARRDVPDEPLQLLATLDEFQTLLEGRSPPPGTRKRRDAAAIALAMAVLRRVRAGHTITLDPVGAGIATDREGADEIPEDVRRLVSRGMSLREARRRTLDPDRSIPPIDIEAELSLLGAPPDEEPTDREAIRRLVERAMRTMESEDAWPGLERETQHALVSHLTARFLWIVRELLPEVPDPTSDARIGNALRRLTQYCRRHEPGFVHGLARSAEPRYGSWFQDTHVTWVILSDEVEREVGSLNPERALMQLREADPSSLPPAELRRLVSRALNAGVSQDDSRLIQLLEGRAEDLEGRAFKALRRNIRGWASSEQEESGPAAGPIPDDWPWWPLVEGKSVVMIGGDLRTDARDRLQQAFRLASLEWVRTDKLGPIQDLERRIRRGGLDQLWILRSYVPHKVDEMLLPSCRRQGLPWVHIERGYGVTQVRRSIERYLSPPESSA